jgi:PAS domain S-box-containing protein
MAGETLVATREPDAPRPLQVLVIDANEGHQMLSALALGRKGFRVTIASTGREGLRLALSQDFDAIILDHKVKDRPSFEVLVSLVERLPKTPMIYVVSPGAEDQAAKALEAGATGYLVKTARYNEVLPAEVEDQIRKAQDHARLQEQQEALTKGRSERTQLEEALRESEERLGLILERAPFVLWTADPDLNVTSSLGSGLSRIKLVPSRILGHNVAELFPQGDGTHPFLAAHRQALAGEATRFVQDFQGRIFDVHVGPLRRKGGPVLGVFGVALDMTDRVRSEKVQSALYRISEATVSTPNLQELFRSLHAIVGELMPVKNFYIALCDPATEMISFPYFVDEAESNPGPQKADRGLTEYVLRTGKPLLASPSVFEELVKAGEVISIGPPSIDWLGAPLMSKGRTIGVLVVQSYTEGVRYTEEDREILKFVSSQIAMAIERKEAEDALREKERSLSTLIGNLPGVAYRCRNDPNWTDEFVSEGIQALLGYTAEDMVRNGVPWADIVHPEDREQVWDDVQRAVSEKRPYRLTYRVRTRQGRTKWVWEQGCGVYSSNGELLALEGFIADVSPWRPPVEDSRRERVELAK